MAQNRSCGGVSGIQVHDARMVAAMRVHGIANLLTLNAKDFRRYGGITSPKFQIVLDGNMLINK
jgi:hypothetical protein